MEVLKEEYINSFSEDLDKHNLYNLCSGIPVPDDLSKSILKTKENEQTAYSSFVEECLNNDDKMFHDPIKRKPMYLFKYTAQKVIIKKNGKTKIIEL